MPRSSGRALALAALFQLASLTSLAAQARPRPDPRLERLKREAIADVDARAAETARMVDQIFSFGELGFQEFETSRYLVDLLRREGFAVQEGFSGIPTAWVARWWPAARTPAHRPTGSRPRRWPPAPPPERPLRAWARPA